MKNDLLQVLQTHCLKKFKGWPIEENTREAIEDELNNFLAEKFPVAKKHFYVLAHMNRTNITFSTVYKQ
jgi:hypothetical protein